MKWFEGKIPDAIQISKQKGSLFIVYIYGKDELSNQMNDTWESTAVSNYLEENGAVAVRIENTSEECKFFSQIYPVVVVPSVFCIGEGGVPLEVMGGQIAPDDFVNKVKQVEQLHAAQKESNTPPTPNTGQQTTAVAPPIPGQVTQNDTPSTSQAGASGDQASAAPLEERVEKVKEIMEKKRSDKAQQEFDKRREEEVKRRKLGQDLQKLKQNQQEIQMKELKEQMRKDREDDKRAKEKIRQQIARDREERQAKFDKEKKERDKAAEEKKKEKLLEQQRMAAAEEARKSESARIQVRLPDGSSMTQTFPSTDTLLTLHTVVSQRVGKSVSFSTTFPKRRFTEEDMSRTFTDLELAPSAVLIAVPGGGAPRQAAGSSPSSAVQSAGLFSVLFSPFIFIWNFLYSLLFGRRGDQNQQQETSSQQSSTPQPYTRPDRPTTAYQRRTGDSGGRREGNMRRLADLRDDEDDMSTYNGNSTQQM